MLSQMLHKSEKELLTLFIPRPLPLSLSESQPHRRTSIAIQHLSLADIQDQKDHHETNLVEIATLDQAEQKPYS